MTNMVMEKATLQYLHYIQLHFLIFCEPSQVQAKGPPEKSPEIGQQWHREDSKVLYNTCVISRKK